MTQWAQAAGLAEVTSERTSSVFLTSARIPFYARAVLESMNVAARDTARLQQLADHEWRDVLKLCDRSQLTLQLGSLANDALPDRVRRRIEKDNRGNAIRFGRIQDAYAEIADALNTRGIEFVTLKGFTHSPELTPDPLLRAQGDLDLWIAAGQMDEAHGALYGLGYRDHGHAERRHRAPMLRPTRWEWTGDYHAPDLPISVELHFGLWDEKQSLIGSLGEGEFWERRRRIVLGGRFVTALNLPDTVGFAALHLLMHLLRGDIRLQRAWEIAHFLHTHRTNAGFWREWEEAHADSLQQLETIIFRLVATWFGGSLPAVLDGVRLEPDTEFWLARYPLSPIEALFRPIKDELWLHLSLLHSTRQKACVFLMRVFPVGAAAIQSSIHSDAQPGVLRRLKETAPFLLSRIAHHAAALIPVLLGGVKWWWRRQEVGREFVMYQIASTLFNFGAFLFFLLYNLYMLGLGLREDAIGQVQSAMTAGTLLGAIPAAALVRRFGLRTALLTSVLGGAVSMLIRAVVVDRIGLLAGSFLNGAFFSIWAVTLAPAVADFTTERNRARGFSYVSALGIGIGISASLVGGQMPDWFHQHLNVPGGLQSIRLTLLTGTAILLTAVIPMAKLRVPKHHKGTERTYPRSPFIVRFLAILAVWSFATGAFNPFANAYFSTVWHKSVPAIGRMFSFSQLAQVAGVMAAPALLRRVGDATGIALTQVATAIALALLAFASGGVGGTVLYGAYMSFQYASEPGLFDLLMSGVKPSERGGASALQFLVVSLAGSTAALLGGFAIARWGYGAVLPLAAVVAAVAAFLFWLWAPSWQTSTGKQAHPICEVRQLPTNS